MLTWWICCRFYLWPGRGWCSRSNLTPKHLLTAYPSCLVVYGIEPGSDYLLRQIHVPDTDQVLMESFIPHKSSCMVWSIRDSCEEACHILLHHCAVFKDHSVAVHVCQTAKHVTQCILAGGELILRPRVRPLRLFTTPVQVLLFNCVLLL